MHTRCNTILCSFVTADSTVTAWSTDVHTGYTGPEEKNTEHSDAVPNEAGMNVINPKLSLVSKKSQTHTT